MSGGGQRSALPALATGGLGCTVALWSLGRLTTPPPAVMAALLVASAALGVALALASRQRRGLAARAAFVAGLACLAGAAAFVAVLFRAGDGEVAISRTAPGRDAAPDRLRLVSFNVLHGYPGLRRQEGRARRLAAALRALDPTVVVLQEAWWTARHGQLAARLGAELGMDVAYARANGSRRLIGFEEGGAVLSRLPITEARRVALSPRRPPWETRVALFVRLALGAGAGDLTVVGAHLGRGPEVAAGQAHDLAARLPASGFVVVAGDFNARSDSAAARALTARGLVDLVPGAIDHVFMAGRPEAWRLVDARWTLRPEDLAALAGADGSRSAGAGADPLSDHPGVVVDLAVAGSGIR